MDDTNHTHAAPHDHWNELTHTTPDIPDAPAAKPNDIDWQTLGEYDWHYTVATGHFGDDEPENEAARERRDRIRAHINHLGVDQLRAYLNGVLTGADTYMWHGL